MRDFCWCLIAGFQEFRKIIHGFGVAKQQEKALSEDGRAKLDTTSRSLDGGD